MTPAESAEFSRQLAARGWRYDPAIQEFFDGKRLLEWEDVIKLVPGMTLDDLTTWEASQQSKLRQVRYWIEPGTATSVSRDGGPFHPFKTTENLVFEAPAEDAEGLFVFATGTWRIRVAKALAWRYEWDGTKGTKQRCG